MKDNIISKDSLFKKKFNENKAHAFAYGLYLLIDKTDEKNLENNIRKAILLRESDEIDRSIKLLSQIMQEHEDDRIYYEQSINFKEKKDFKKAFSEINKIKDIKSDRSYFQMYLFLKKSLEL